MIKLKNIHEKIDTKCIWIYQIKNLKKISERIQKNTKKKNLHLNIIQKGNLDSVMRGDINGV